MVSDDEIVSEVLHALGCIRAGTASLNSAAERCFLNLLLAAAFEPKVVYQPPHMPDVIAEQQADDGPELAPDKIIPPAATEPGEMGN